MSKKYSLYVNNDNLYGCSGTYKVMDGKGTTLVAETALTLAESGKTKIGEQTVSDTEVAYWGGTRFTFTSVGAPTSVSGEISRNDYHYYDLNATPITYYFGNNFSMSFALTLTAISGQTITYPKTFSIATNENFTNAESVSFASAGTQSLHYTESNFGGDKGTGYLYIKDTENNAVYMFINTLKIFNKPTLTQTSISASGTTYSVVFSATNPNDIECNLWTTNYTEAFTDQGTISANGTKSFTITSSSTTGIAHAYLKLDNVQSTENSKSWEYIKTLVAPALSTPSVTSSTVSLYISNESNDVSVTFNGTYTGDDGVARAIQTTVGGGSHRVISISWLSEMSFYTIVGKFSASGYNTSVDSNEITVSKPTTPTLAPIVLNSATLHSDGTLEVSYTNSNSVNVSGLFYWQGGAYNASETFTTGTHTLTETGVPTNSSSCFVGTISATGYNDGSTSNTLTYTVTTLSTIYFNGASSVEVGSTSNIYISDSAGDAISGLTVVSSDTGIGTIELVSGTLYHLAGVTAGTFIITASATGYTSNSHSITSSLPTPTLSQPEIAYDDTVTPNQDGSYYKKSVVSVTNSNSQTVSYSASVDGIASYGSLGPNATTTIGTWEVTDSYGSNTFSVSCSFTASGYNGSSISTSHTL